MTDCNWEGVNICIKSGRDVFWRAFIFAFPVGQTTCPPVCCVAALLYEAKLRDSPAHRVWQEARLGVWCDLALQETPPAVPALIEKLGRKVLTSQAEAPMGVWASQVVVIALRSLLPSDRYCPQIFSSMIPTKILVYREPDGGTRTETFHSPRRRKKSCGDLFQNGYRVKPVHGQVTDKEDQDNVCHSLSSCFHVISYWGKALKVKEQLWFPAVSACAGALPCSCMCAGVMVVFHYLIVYINFGLWKDSYKIIYASKVSFGQKRISFGSRFFSFMPAFICDCLNNSCGKIPFC